MSGVKIEGGSKKGKIKPSTLDNGDVRRKVRGSVDLPSANFIEEPPNGKVPVTNGLFAKMSRFQN